MESQWQGVNERKLNAYALNEFMYERVDDRMITYLAAAARNVIRCNDRMMPQPQVNNSYHSDLRLPPSPPTTPPPPVEVRPEHDNLPTLEQFIKNLVRSSNVQVPTLMSTLVYLTRIKNELQPDAKGLRCTAHRIFLACLILAAKFLNDSSPKNKHWAAYTRMRVSENLPTFGFSTTEVNKMEMQAIEIIKWQNLRISEADLYCELEPFLAPLREEALAKREREQRRAAMAAAEAEQRRYRQEQRRLAEERQLEEERQAAERWMAQYSTPQSSPESGNWRSHSRQTTPDSLPALSSSYNSSRSISSSHSYASSLSSTRDGNSGATTPLSYKEGSSINGEPYIYDGVLHMGNSGSLYEAPEIIEQPHHKMQQMQMQMPARPQLVKQKSLLPYEISPEELQHLQEGGGRVKRMRGMFGRMFGASNTASR